MNLMKHLILTLLIVALSAFVLRAHEGESTYLRFKLHELQQVKTLEHNWHLYWGATQATYQKGLVKPDHLYIPGDWRNLGYPSKGYGVFECKMIVDGAANTELALYVPSVCNAYNVYLNGLFVGSAGIFGVSADSTIPDYVPQILHLKPASDTLVLTFELSSFYYREGGLTYPIKMGLVVPMESWFNNLLISSSFYSGALLLMFIYFIGFFVIRKRERSALYFALLCFVAAFRIMSTDILILRQLHVPISWATVVKIELGSVLLMPAFGALYLFELVKEKRFRWVLHVFNSLIAIGFLYVVLTPVYYASFIVPWFRVYALFQLVFMLVIMYRAAFVHKLLLGRWAAAGYLVVFICGINDILYSANVINTFYSMSIAIFVYVFIQAMVLAKSFAEAYTQAEGLSAELVTANKNQEAIIKYRTQELDQKTKALASYNDIKDKIFSIIGHDLRAPIATLSQVLTLAENADEQTLGELRTYFKGIKRNVDNLHLTLENLLQWSQAQINGVASSKQPVSILQEIEQVVNLYSLAALQKGITLMHQLTSDWQVDADKAHLNLILRNLVNNSIKFTNTGGQVMITVSPIEGNQLEVCIADNGIGIHPDKLVLLQHPESHFTTYGTANEKGTGLGLRLCREYVEQMGGSLNIQSNQGLGTKVCLNLKLV